MALTFLPHWGHSAVMDTVCTSLAFIDGLGAPEMMLIFVVVLVLFGGQKLPEFARGIGKTLREFKKAAAGVEEEFKRALDEDERKQNQIKLAETTTPALTAPAAETTAGPDAAQDHYSDYSHDQDYHSTHPETPAATPAPAAEAGPENKILAPEITAAPAAPATPTVSSDYTDAPTPAPAAPSVEPAKNSQPVGDQPKAP